jgi:sugar lactone lactonase YvrE
MNRQTMTSLTRTAPIQTFELPGDAVFPESVGLDPETGAAYVGSLADGGVSNTATRNIVAVPIRADGQAGKVAVRFTGIQADDFAFAANGDLYITENPLSRLIRVTPDGVTTTLATKTDGLDNPSAVAFDPRPHHRKDLYVTNAAYFGTHPSLQVTATGDVGQRLP